VRTQRSAPFSPTKCFTLPEGFECWKGAGEAGNADGEKCMDGDGTEALADAERLKDACGGCEVVDPTVGEKEGALGLAIMPLSKKAFGGKCHNLESASAQIKKGGGSWPGKDGYGLPELPAAMRVKPDSCYQLPEGFLCFKHSSSDGQCPVMADTLVEPTDDPACGGCTDAANPAGVKSAIEKNAFGSKCHTSASASANIIAGGGHWPGIQDFSALALPAAMKEPTAMKKCFQLPEGFECSMPEGADGKCGKE